jgi:phenylalanyl-tRNA synthetase beta chain
MKVTLEWLKEFVDTEASASEIGALLTMLGFELESIQESPMGPILDFKVTPNRGDCLSVLGVARELCAKDPERYKPTPLMLECVQGLKRGDEGDAEIKEFAKVEVQEPDLCPRYGARVFRDIEVRPSSEKIQARLLACGMRPINLIVDLTNYVMLELGQPLHAFDLDLLSQSTIVVRLPKPGERITTLDGVERSLQENMLLICDAEKPVAIAGVMGGANSEVHPKTKNILLESAHFHAESIRKTRKQLGLSTDASYRFERYVDPEGVVRALNRFAYLLQQEGGKEPVRGIWDVRKDFTPPQPVVVRPKRWNLLLGLEIPTAVAGAHLHSLGCLVKEEKDGSLRVTPPSWRMDLKEEDDFVEEIGRLYGYERIPERLPEGRTVIAKEDERSALLSRARQVFLRLGFTEVLNHTFCEPSPLDAPSGERYQLRNPVAPEFRLLRNSLLPGLMNGARKHPRGPLFLFEIGRVYSPSPRVGNQWAVGFLMRGRLLEEHWEKKESPEVDFYVGKGVVEQFLRLMHYSHLGNFFIPPEPDPRFDPAFQAGIGHPVEALLGIFGELRRSLAEEFHMTERIVLGEIFLENLMKYDEEGRRGGRGAPALRYKPLSPYPPVRRDIAIAVPKTVRISEIEKAIREEAGDVLESLRLIDRYEGKGIPEGHHSLAFAMVYRHPHRTLTDEEANEIRDRVLSRLSQLGARAR